MTRAARLRFDFFTCMKAPGRIQIQLNDACPIPSVTNRISERGFYRTVAASPTDGELRIANCRLEKIASGDSPHFADACACTSTVSFLATACSIIKLRY